MNFSSPHQSATGGLDRPLIPDEFGTMRHFVILLSLLFSTLAGAQIRMTNPGLPVREHLVYADRQGGVVRTFDQSLQFHPEGPWYELITHSYDADITVRMDPNTLFITSIDSTSRTKDAVLRRQLQVVQVLHKSADDELVVNDLSSLATVLRAFPWKSASFARLVYLGSNAASGDFSFELKVTGRQTLSLAGKSYDCYVVDVGLAGVFGAFVGHTTLWYDITSPHVLVKSVAPVGGPGSPMRTFELQSYETK